MGTTCTWALTLTTALLLATSALADKKQEFRYAAGPGATVTVVNQFGPVSVQPAAGRQVVATCTIHSDKVEVDQLQNGKRIELRTHILQRGSDDDARVEYQLQVPADATVVIRSATGPLQVQGLEGDISVQGESAPVTIRDLKNGHLQVHTVSGPVTLTNVANTHVEITSVGGAVSLTNVTGPKVTVNTTNGSIRYTGDFGSNGSYTLMNHSGDIEVLLPARASVDLTARSVNGSVQNDFPFAPKAHNSFVSTEGRSLAGTANSGASSVRLSSFSGAISVKKQ